MKESKLRDDMIKWLIDNGHHARRHTQSVTEERGLPDIYAGIFSYYVEIEVKTGSSYKQTAIQKYQQKICEERGCQYWVVESMDELKDNVSCLAQAIWEMDNEIRNRAITSSGRRE